MRGDGPLALPGAAGPLLAAFSREALARNGVPEAGAAADRQECLRLLTEHLGSSLAPLHCSVLGAAWTEVFDAYPRQPIDDQRLERLGWLPMDRLDRRGRHARGSGTRLWAVVAEGRVLAGVLVHPGPDTYDPVAALIDRCRAAGEVRLREVLELCELRRQHHDFPANADVVRVAAEIESGLGGRVLAPWASGRLRAAPGRLAGRPPARRLVVAVSGVDGSGKTTLRAGVTASLQRCGIPVSTVWVRPGMGIGWLVTVAARVKRLLGQNARPGIRSVATADGVPLRSRTGAVGWIWVMLVVGSFLRGVWRQHRVASGIVVYDRHLVDALATLDFAYAGVHLQVAHRLIRALLPPADVTIYLDVPVEVSVARKPDDLLGESAVRRQLAAYEKWLAAIPPTVRLDAVAAQADILASALRVLAYGPHGGAAPMAL